MTAVSGDVSDGELRPVPVLPGRMHLIESRFVAVKEGSPRTMKFEEMAKTDDPTHLDEQLVVTVDAQLFESVLNALPYLVHYPYECTEQTLNRFVPTAIVSALFRDYPAIAKMAEGLAKRETRLETWDAADPNRKIVDASVCRGGQSRPGQFPLRRRHRSLRQSHRPAPVLGRLPECIPGEELDGRDSRLATLARPPRPRPHPRRPPRHLCRRRGPS